MDRRGEKVAVAATAWLAGASGILCAVLIYAAVILGTIVLGGLPGHHRVPEREIVARIVRNYMACWPRDPRRHLLRNGVRP